MIDLFLALSAIPDIMFGAVHYPRTTAAVLVSGLLIGIAAVILTPEPQRPIVVPAVEKQAVEPVGKDRRIVRFARWLWEAPR